MANQPTFGILVPSPIRVNDFDDNYPSAFAIDIKGGHHMFATITERNAITEGRREWGMLCTVYNNITDTVNPDASKNGTYQLVRGASNTDITNNNNWRIFSGGPSTISNGEWLISVSSVLDQQPGVTPSNGTRFLVATPSFAAFGSHPNKIAEWNDSANAGLGGYDFTTPTEGTTLRVDDKKNVLYKFNGTWSEGGFWSKEYLTQIRYIQPVSNEGTTYSFTSSNSFVSLDSYSYSVYYANFGYTNSGSASLQIDGLGYFPLRKRGPSSSVPLSSQDLIPNISYHISWNNDSFFVHNIGGPSSFLGVSSSVIGIPEDGTYADGLFTDFNPDFPIGFAIDRINEVLKGLVPPPAKDLQQWTLAGPSFVEGRVSFDSANAGAYSLTPVPGLGRGGDFNISGQRKGINSLVAQPNNTGVNVYADITGTLNGGVSADSNGAYAANSFGNGLTGSLVLKLNGTTISNINLANPAANNSTGGPHGGLNVTAATSSKFPSGLGFESFWNRQGTYLIKKDSPLLVDGYNYIELSHILQSTTLTVPSYNWLSDGSTSLTTYTNPGVSSLAGANAKYLSGIQFWTTLTFNYDVTLQNHVKNTYVKSGAITVANTKPSTDNPVLNKQTVTNTPIMVNPSAKDISTVVNTTPNNPNSTESVSFAFTLLTQNVRRLNESINLSMSVARTVQGANSGGNFEIKELFIDNYPVSSSLSVENFLSEGYRLRNGVTRYEGTTDTTQNMLTLNWDSQKSLNDDTNHKNGLQVINGSLVYPNFNYNTPGGSTTKNPNYNKGTTVNYTDCDLTTTGFNESGGAGTNYRTFTRYFQVDSTKAWSTLEFNFSYENTEFVNYNQSLSNSNKVWVEIKLPRDPAKAIPPATVQPQLVGAAITGWLDMTKPFKESEGRANGAGVLSGNRPTATTGTNVVWRVNFGPGINTDYSTGYVLFRLTASPGWAGSITSISVKGV